MPLTSAQKFLAVIAGIVSNVTGAVIGGAAQAYQVPVLGPSGQLDLTMMPTGIGPDTQSLPATEALIAGALVNVWVSGGTTSVRNADSSGTGKPCHGFVLAAVASAGQALVYYGGLNTSVTGLTPGATYWLGSVGAATTAPPTAAGTTTQQIGTALTATELQVNPQAQINN